MLIDIVLDSSVSLQTIKINSYIHCTKRITYLTESMTNTTSSMVILVSAMFVDKII